MPLNINIQQILLHMFNLVLLFGILYFLLYKPVKDFMAKRREEYERIDANAHEDMQQASDLKQKYEDKLAAADKEIADMRAANSKSNEEERARIIDEANEKAEEIIAKARKKAASEADRIKAETEAEIADYVSDMAGKIVGGSKQGFDEFFAAADIKEDSEEA